MNIRIYTLITAVALIGLPAACGKDSGGSKKSSKPTPTPTAPRPASSSQTATPTTPTQPTIQAWEQFNGKAIAFQQSIPADSAKFSLTAVTYETYFQNGQVNRNADRTPANVNGTMCFLRYRLGTLKSQTAVDAGTRFVVSQAIAPEQKTTYTEATIDGQMQNSASGNDKVSKIICRKHVDAGPITAGDLQTAMGPYIQIQN